MLDLSSILTPIAGELGIGGIGGFFSGWALKKAAKLVAAIIGLSFLGLQYLAYQGIIDATEFEIYAATKVYLCYSLVSSHATEDLPTIFPSVDTYNEGNVISGRFSNVQYLHVGVQDEFYCNSFELTNLYFSRLAVIGYSYIKFLGYRVTLD